MQIKKISVRLALDFQNLDIIDRIFLQTAWKNFHVMFKCLKKILMI